LLFLAGSFVTSLVRVTFAAGQLRGVCP
jgi:hypothetical protein